MALRILGWWWKCAVFVADLGVFIHELLKAGTWFDGWLIDITVD